MSDFRRLASDLANAAWPLLSAFPRMTSAAKDRYLYSLAGSFDQHALVPLKRLRNLARRWSGNG